MRRASQPELRQGDVAVVGIPCDAHSSFARGAAAGPDQIRKALLCPSTNLSTEGGLDLDGDDRFVDAGDVALEEGARGADAVRAMERHLAAVLGTGAAVVALGGDHAISYPVVRAHASVHGPLAIVHLDAHPDLYDAFEGDRYSHACPFARIVEDGLARSKTETSCPTCGSLQQKK